MIGRTRLLIKTACLSMIYFMEDLVILSETSILSIRKSISAKDGYAGEQFPL